MPQIQTEQDIAALLKQSSYHLKALKAVAKLVVPNMWIAAGFVRNYVWDALYNDGKMTRLNDLDVIYFDKSDISQATEKKYEFLLQSSHLEYPWSVKNQARMHEKNGDEPYTDIDDALSRWCETVTPIGARLNDKDEIEILAPLGIDDLINGKCHATPHAKAKPSKIDDYKKRMDDKKWWLVWDGVTVYDLDN